MLGFNYRGFGRWYIILRNSELTGQVKLRHVHVTIFALEKQEIFNIVCVCVCVCVCIVALVI
jgi:hypothetical protein